MDDSGRVISKEEEIVMKKVKEIMVKAGIIPTDKEMEIEAMQEKVDPVSTRSPYRRDRPRPSVYEHPDVICNRLSLFRNKVTESRTLNGEEIA